jgi:hypothetical protein
MSIKSSGDSTVPPIKTLLTNPQDGEALTYNAATGTFINGIPFTTVKPVLTGPSNASNLEALTNYTFQTSTSFSVAPANYLLTHYATDWQIAGDAEFSTILTYSTLDTSNKTSWTAQFVAGYPQVYVRLRFHNGQEYSAYSDTVIYNVTQVYNFTSTQNFTVPAGVSAIQVNLLGGGGGSSGGTNPQGGGGGGVSQSNSLAVTPSTEYLVTVGAGSVGGNAAGSSSFGNLLSVNGGSGVTSGNGFGKGNASNMGGADGGAGGAGGKGGDGGGFSWEGVGARYGGSGGPGVSLSIDSTTRGGGGGAGVTGGGNTNMGYGGIGQHGGGNGYSGGSHGWFGQGNNGQNTYGGGAGGSNQGNSTGGNGVVRIKF